MGISFGGRGVVLKGNCQFSERVRGTDLLYGTWLFLFLVLLFVCVCGFLSFLLSTAGRVSPKPSLEIANKTCSSA